MFVCDTAQAIVNFEKHGVSFEEACTAFADPDGLIIEDVVHSKREPRYKRLGVSILLKTLLVVYTLRKQPNGQEAIGIISAGRASRKERQAYVSRKY